MDVSGKKPDWKRVLLVRPSALGDVCRTVPAVVSIRRALPGVEIDWVVQDTFIDAVRAHPDVREVIPFSRRKYSEVWRSARTLREFREWIAGLRRREYDAAIDLQGLGRSALITYLSGARRRIGFSGVREFAWIGYTERHEPPRSRHVVDQMLELLEHESIEPVRDMRLYTPAEDRAWWTAQRAQLQLESPYVVLAPTSRHATKRWPAERWIELIPYLRDRGYAGTVIIGAPAERSQITPLLEVMHQDESLIDLVGSTTVGQTLAVVEDSALVIANDSAPLHMAVGFDRPVVGLFGPTDPAFVGPYGRADSIVRAIDPEADAPVNYRDASIGDSLMRRITIEMVVGRLDHGMGNRE